MSSGFSLLEIIIALVVSAIILVGARATIDATTALAERSTAYGEESARARNGERLLRRLVSNAFVADTTEAFFAGDEKHVHLATRCAAPAGWTEPCIARFTIEQLDGVPRIVLRYQGAVPLVVMRAHARLEFAFLVNAAYGGTWIQSWGNSLSLPVALGIWRDDELLILPIGARG